MIYYLQWLVLFVLLVWLVAYGWHFFSYKGDEVEKKEGQYLLGMVKWVMSFLLLFVYSFFVVVYYLVQTEDLLILFDSREVFLILAWVVLVAFIVAEWRVNFSLGFFITPLVVFMVLLGVTANRAPELYSLNRFDHFEDLAIWRNQEVLVSLLAKQFYFYAVIISVVHYRLYIELKYHLTRVFISRLPSINVVDKVISRYLIWGGIVSGLAWLLQVWVAYSMGEVLAWQKSVVAFFVLFLFFSIWWVRKKKYLNIKLNLIVMVIGLFFQLFELLYL